MKNQFHKNDKMYVPINTQEHKCMHTNLKLKFSMRNLEGGDVSQVDEGGISAKTDDA